jgi:hypothetical protein
MAPRHWRGDDDNLLPRAVLSEISGQGIGELFDIAGRGDQRHDRYRHRGRRVDRIASILITSRTAAAATIAGAEYSGGHPASSRGRRDEAPQ